MLELRKWIEENVFLIKTPYRPFDDGPTLDEIEEKWVSRKSEWELEFPDITEKGAEKGHISEKSD
jgi:hypothetical protein